MLQKHKPRSQVKGEMESVSGDVERIQSCCALGVPIAVSFRSFLGCFGN